MCLLSVASAPCLSMKDHAFQLATHAKVKLELYTKRRLTAKFAEWKLQLEDWMGAVRSMYPVPDPADIDDETCEPMKWKLSLPSLGPLLQSQAVIDSARQPSSGRVPPCTAHSCQLLDDFTVQTSNMPRRVHVTSSAVLLRNGGWLNLFHRKTICAGMKERTERKGTKIISYAV